MRDRPGSRRAGAMWPSGPRCHAPAPPRTTVEIASAATRAPGSAPAPAHSPAPAPAPAHSPTAASSFALGPDLAPAPTPRTDRSCAAGSLLSGPAARSKRCHLFAISYIEPASPASSAAFLASSRSAYRNARGVAVPRAGLPTAVRRPRAPASYRCSPRDPRKRFAGLDARDDHHRATIEERMRVRRSTAHRDPRAFFSPGYRARVYYLSRLVSHRSAKGGSAS